MLEVKHLSVSFEIENKRYKVIDDLSFDIVKGQTLALLGESGCGKSMTALALLQLLPLGASIHKESRIFYKGCDLLMLPGSKLRKIRGKKIAIIFQDPMTSLNPVLTIGQQLSEALPRQKRSFKQNSEQTLIELLQKVKLSEPKRRLQQYPHQLSGGQKQRVMIAMAIAAKPDILIADEPTTALDVTIQAQILALLKELQAEMGMGLLLITHDLKTAEKMADKVAVMYAGQMVEKADAMNFFGCPKHPYSHKLLKARPSFKKRHQKLEDLKGRVPSITHMVSGCRFRPRCDYAAKACVNMPGLEVVEQSQVRCFFPIHKNDASDIKFETIVSNHLEAKKLFEVCHLKVYYPIYRGLLKRKVSDVKAVDGLSFSLNAGETLALVGESGCGKSTLSKALMHLLPLTDGDIFFEGERVTDGLTAKQMKAYRRNVQMVFQDPFASMNPRMVIKDIILEGVIAHKLLAPNKRTRWALELLDKVGLPSASLERYPHQFSGGQRQRICIARALAMKPKVIICDEPTSALDVSVQAQVLNLLQQLQKELNLSYLFISHDLSVVSYIADKVMVMRHGKIVESGDLETVIAAPQADYTKKLLSAVA